jgi:hypothetical protein
MSKNLIVLKLIVLLLLLSTSNVICQKKQVCDFDYFGFITNEDYLECVKSIPTQSTDHYSQLLTVMETAYSLYAYKDIMRNSSLNSPYNLQVTVEENLAQLKQSVLSNQISNDYEFQRKLEKSFTALKDPHTMYFPPTCYTDFVYCYPFMIGSKLKSTFNGYRQLYTFEQVLSGFEFLYTEGYDSLYETSTSFDNYYGWTIITVNGQETGTYLSNWLNQNTYSRDESIRFNRLVHSTEFFLRADGEPFETLRMTLQHPTVESNRAEVTVHGIVLNTNSLSSSIQTPLQKLVFNCGYSSKGRSLDATYQNMNPFEVITQPDKYKKLVDKIKQNVPAKRSKKENVLGTEDSFEMDIVDSLQSIVRFHVLTRVTGAKIGILELTTFHPDYKLVPYFLAAVAQSLSEGKKRNIDHLILDLRSNTGGYVCLGMSVIRYLVPHLPTLTYPLADYSYSSIGETLLATCTGVASLPVLERTKKPTTSETNTNWYSKQTKFRGGRSAKYSEPFYLTCPSAFRFDPSSYFLDTPYDSTTLTILTDGSCGSTCGIITKILQLTGNAKVVSFGGLYSHKSGESTIDMEVASYNGALVLDMSYIISTTRSGGICTSNPIPRFPSTEQATFAYLELYPVTKISAYDKSKANTTTPLEFVKNPADIHIWKWTTDAQEIYSATADVILNKCLNWEYKVDYTCNQTVARGIYGRSCKDNEWINGECILFRCEEGYYLNEDKRCTPDPEYYPVKNNVPADSQTFGSGLTSSSDTTSISYPYTVVLLLAFSILFIINFG